MPTPVAWKVATPSDRYFTPQELLELTCELWPGGIDCDPCWDPLSKVVAGRCYDKRADQDGLVLPWVGKVFLNPPYAPAPIKWLERAAAHALDEGCEVLGLVPAAVSSDYWARHVWPTASVCCLAPRPKFSTPTSAKPTIHLRDCAVIYWGRHHDEFRAVWGRRGVIVRADLAWLWGEGRDQVAGSTCPENPESLVATKVSVDS